MKKHTILSPTEPGVCPLLAPAADVAHGIVSRAVLTTAALRVTLFQFAPGQELSEHTSTARALVQIVAGSCEFTVGNTRHLLKAGDLLHLPPRVPHALVALESLSMLLTQVTEPTA